jgi:hypothetical protein
MIICLFIDPGEEISLAATGTYLNFSNTGFITALISPKAFKFISEFNSPIGVIMKQLFGSSSFLSALFSLPCSIKGLKFQLLNVNLWKNTLPKNKDTRRTQAHSLTLLQYA